MGFRSEREETRWLAARNVGEAAIPSFGICCLASEVPLEEERGTLIYRVSIPGTEQVAENNAAICFVNSTQIILPSKTGRVTQDWPAQVLLDSDIAGLDGRSQCGPRDGEPTVCGGIGPFTYLGDDPTLPMDFGNGLLVGLIAPAIPGQSIYKGTLDGDLNSGSSQTVSVTINGEAVEFTIHDNGDIETGQKLESGCMVRFYYNAEEEEFEIFNSPCCPVDQ